MISVSYLALSSLATDLVDALVLEPGAIDAEFVGPHIDISKNGVFGLPPLNFVEEPNDMRLKLQLKNLNLRFPTNLVVTTVVDACWDDCNLEILIPGNGMVYI